jgi:hypothetical protein
MATNTNPNDRRDANRDPITGAPGSHPIGTGVGAAGGGAAGAAAGAAIGAAAGPVGAVVGGVAGAVVGALGGGAAGKEVAEMIDPTEENAYWEKNYTTRPYYTPGTSYDDYRPAYQTGWESRTRYADRSFDEVEPELQSTYEKRHSSARVKWDRAKFAAKDAWQRASDKIERAIPGDSDRDGN